MKRTHVTNADATASKLDVDGTINVFADPPHAAPVPPDDDMTA